MIMPQTLYGMHVNVTTLATKTVGKVALMKRWHTGRNYRQRIAKKWAKRFGPPKHEPACYVSQANQMIIIHPELWERIKKSGVLP